MTEQYAESRRVDNVVVTQVYSNEIEEEFNRIVAQLSSTNKYNHHVIILIPELENITDRKKRIHLYNTLIKTIVEKPGIEIWYFKEVINNLNKVSRYEYLKQIV